MTWNITGVAMLNVQTEEWSIQFSERSHEHRFFHDALRWRAAEYGIDPLDSPTLFDVLMHERFIDTRHQNAGFLWTSDQATARATHLSKIEAVRSTVALADPQNLAAAIHTYHTKTFSVARHTAYTSYVDSCRRGRPDRVALLLATGSRVVGG